MTISGVWQAIWPNLAADVIWVPCVWLWHRTHLARALETQRDHFVREVREHFEKEN